MQRSSIWSRPRVREAHGGCMQPQRRRETRQPGAAVHWAARRHKRSCGRHMCGLRDGVCSLRGDIRGLWCGMRGLWAAYTVWTTACAVCAAGRARVHIGIFAYSLRICIHIRIQLCRCTCECAAWRFAAALAGAMSGVHPQMRAALGRPRCVSPGDAASPADARRSRPPAESVGTRHGPSGVWRRAPRRRRVLRQKNTLPRAKCTALRAAVVFCCPGVVY